MHSETVESLAGRVTLKIMLPRNWNYLPGYEVLWLLVLIFKAVL